MNFEDIASVTDSGNDAFTAPEPITVGDSGGIASSYPLQMTPRTDIPDADSGRADDGAVSPDEPEGESLCRAYDIVEYPTILAMDGQGKMLQMWRGRDLPRIDDVSYYLLEN